MNRIIRFTDLGREKSGKIHSLKAQKGVLIELLNVEKRYPSGRNNRGAGHPFPALTRVSLSVPLNTNTLIIGPSGSGKTTLLSLIGCMARPTSGRIYLGDREVTSLPERFLSEIRRDRFGFIFQNFNLIPGLTVLENTMLPTIPTNRKPKHIKARAMEILERLKIVSKARQNVQYLSGGEKQRVTIARALINEPPIIIADEPTAHLNTHQSLEFLDLLADLQTEGKTILIASHDPLLYDSAKVNQVIALRDGKVIEIENRNPLIESC